MTNKHKEKCSGMVVIKQMQTRGLTISWLNWLSSKNQKLINAGENVWNKRYFNALLIGIQASATMWKKVWIFLRNINMDLTMVQYPTPGNLPKGNEISIWKSFLNPCYNSSVHSNLDMELTQMCISWSLDVDIHDTILLSHKKEWQSCPL